MTILPSLIDNVINVYNRVSKLKTSDILEKDQEYPQDTVSISSKAKKMRVIEDAKKEVLEKIREVK